MGKARRNRVRGNRSDPIAKPVKPPSDPELAKLRESKILPVLKDLQSPEAKSRTAAAGAIANIVQDTKCRKLLLREQVVHIVLTETLTDTSIDSRAAGWEILKVLAQEEEADFCVHLYRLDVLTAIEHAAKAIVETLTSTEPPFPKLLKAQQRLVWEITSSLLTLLGLLGLSREEVLQSISGNQTILRLLFRLAATDVAPQEIIEEALSCLTTLSEDHLQLGQAMTNDQETRCYDVLLKLSTGTGPKAVLSCGVLHNLFSSLQWLDHSPGKDGACDAVIIPSLARALEQVLPSSAVANGSSGNAEITQVTLEILASIGTDFQETLVKGNRAPTDPTKANEEWNGFDDETADVDADAMEVDGESDAGAEEEEGDEQDEGDEEDNEDDASVTSEMEADMGLVAGEEGSGSGDLNDLPTLRELIQRAVPQLIRLSNLHSEETLAIQDHALSALNNIAWTISCLEFANGENAHIFSAWHPTAKKIWRKTIAPILEADNADLRLATQVTSLAWAVARTLNGETPSDGRQHRKFISLYHASRNQAPSAGQDTGEKKEEEEAEDPFQGLGVKCIGVLGSLARDPAPIEVNREVGVFLMTLITTSNNETTSTSNNTPPADIVEALNQLFDLYGDEDVPCDREVFWKDGFLKHLEEFVPRLKTLAKGIDKRAQSELRTRADEASLNLGRFVQYKKKHAPK
ncbi:uncharacterized protein C8A04DRAFT_34656 [Dichotomopilus funicola]|uniref:SYO1-like TPR repeats domain-containing protein n=1 Tax=Dichotomopilus funicola TaxID=1934379 RepID=A0AAN6V8C9_9PEZI|nr:hypothetical protein C8A04DRAFT_34656 [Dichotomopilus funicola]